MAGFLFASKRRKQCDSFTVGDFPFLSFSLKRLWLCASGKGDIGGAAISGRKWKKAEKKEWKLEKGTEEEAYKGAGEEKEEKESTAERSLPLPLIPLQEQDVLICPPAQKKGWSCSFSREGHMSNGKLNP